MDVEQDRRRRLASHRQPPLQHERSSTRGRQWLHASHRLFIDALEALLQQTLSVFEQALFAKADRARLPAEQQDHLASLQNMKREREPFGRRFLAQLDVAFERIGETTETSPAPLSPVNPWATLELLDPASQELDMSMEQISARGESHFGSVLHELGYRVAVLLGVPPLESEALPMGPRSLTRTLGSAIEETTLPLEHRLLLLQCFDQHLIQALGPTYVAINEQLQTHGILPHLRGAPLPRQVNQRRARENAGTPAATPNHEPPARVDPAAAPAAIPSHSIEVLESLRNLLAQRHLGSAAGNGANSQLVASTDELQSALGALQQHLAQVTGQASRELRSAQRLQEELLHQINLGKPAQAPLTQLSGEQADTVELVAMLFEQLGEQLHRGGKAQALLGGLQLPMLGMAVADHDFFEKQEHPARKLLDTVTAAAHDWLDGSNDESSRPLAIKLEELVQRANREPPSSGLYTALLADIEHHLSLLNRKAQAAERRQVEAAEGRERLHQARQRAEALMAERFSQSAPRGLLRALFDRAWSDVLALTLLRHGEQSDAFKAQLLITDQLLGHKPVSDRDQLQHDVESGLQQIGMHAQESRQVAQHLVGTGAPAPDELRSATHLALRLKQQHRLGESQKHSANTLPPKPAAKASLPKVPPADPREKAMEEHLRQQPFGRWFEFVTADHAHAVRRKLAWYSPMSGRCLLVSQRGQRGEEMSLAKLAHDLVHGHARELADEKESLLDRAWRGLTGRLHQDARTPASVKSGDRR